jgi:hypothetical protein
MGGANGLLGHMQQPGTPNGLVAGGRMNGNRKKGGLIKSLTRVRARLLLLLLLQLSAAFVGPLLAQ